MSRSSARAADEFDIPGRCSREAIVHRVTMDGEQALHGTFSDTMPDTDEIEYAFDERWTDERERW